MNEYPMKTGSHSTYFRNYIIKVTPLWNTSNKDNLPNKEITLNLFLESQFVRQLLSVPWHLLFVVRKFILSSQTIFS